MNKWLHAQSKSKKGMNTNLQQIFLEEMSVLMLKRCLQHAFRRKELDEHI